MRYRTKLWLLWLIPGSLTLAALLWIGWQVYQVVPDPELRDQTLLWLALAAFFIVGGITVAWGHSLTARDIGIAAWTPNSRAS